MSRVSFTLAVILVLGLPLSSQSFAAQVTASERIVDGLAWVIPTLHDRGSLRAAAGNRLHVVTITLGEDPFETDVRRFVLVTTGGAYEPIGAGARADLIVPLDRIPVNQEVGQILLSNAIVQLTRTSSDRVVFDVGSYGTAAFVFEVPATAAVRALRMPDGRELAAAP
jgi:hypothetical protein